jgi:hypothetical protein
MLTVFLHNQVKQCAARNCHRSDSLPCAALILKGYESVAGPERSPFGGICADRFADVLHENVRLR